MSKSIKGLTQLSDGTWKIDKLVNGRRIYQRLKTRSKREAEIIYAQLVETARQEAATIERPERLWREAAAQYLMDNVGKPNIDDIANFLERLDSWCGEKLLHQVHMGSLNPYVKHRLNKDKVKKKTCNIELGHVRRILNLAADSWRYEDSGLTWLDRAPKIEMLTVDDDAKPYPLDWGEQDELFKKLPKHLANMAMFKVNTGCREAEVCGLRWEWELEIPDFDPVVFFIPANTPLTPRGKQVKNRHDRIVVCNDVASRVIESVRDDDDDYVFVFREKPIGKMNNTGWQTAWTKAGLPDGRVFLKGPHNLKHTYGRRLRAAGVPKSTLRVLLGHAVSADVTDHYSVPEIEELYAASNKVCARNSRKTHAMHIVKRKAAMAVAAN